jgi:hypothetical protein
LLGWSVGACIGIFLLGLINDGFHDQEEVQYIAKINDKEARN